MDTRKRRIKCDETVPSCLRCMKSGWKCDGYAARSFPEESNHSDSRRAQARPRPLSSLRPPLLSIASYSIPFAIPGTQADRQILHYFCVQAGQDIAGFSHSEFWSSVVLQEAHHEPVVRQALVALASIHLDHMATDDSAYGSVATEMTLIRYGKALRAMRSRLQGAGTMAEHIRASIFCSVLFHGFESAIGNTNGSMTHLQSAIYLWSACRRLQLDDSHHHHQQNHHLQQVSSVLSQLDLQASMFDDNRTPRLAVNPYHDQGGGRDSHLWQGLPFTRLQDARQALVALQGWLFQFLNTNARFKSLPEDSIPRNVLDEKAYLTTHFQGWKIRFAAIKQELQDQGREQTECGVQVLVIHWATSYLLLTSDLPHREAVFGASPNAEAEQVISRAEAVAEKMRRHNATAQSATGKPRRNLSLEPGIVAPLVLLALKCSDPSVRDGATRILSTSQRREGLYDAHAMAESVQRLTSLRDEDVSSSFKSSSDEAEIAASLESHFSEELDEAKGAMDIRISDASRLGMLSRRRVQT